MKKGICYGLILLPAAFSACLLIVSSLHAATGVKQASKTIDAVLVLDCTGSMKKSDPLTLRKPAARLFISLLRDKDKAGLVGFDQSGSILAAFAEAGKPEETAGLIKAIEHIQSTGPHTNIEAGLRTGFDMIRSSTSPSRILILMSDGKMDTGDKKKDAEFTESLRNNLIPEISKASVKVYTVAFTEESDQALLKEIAEKTAGYYRLAKTAEDLHMVFASMFEQVKTPDTLPIEGDRFFVDKNIDEITVLATKKNPQTDVVLIDPATKKHSASAAENGFTWFSSQAFDMATIVKPLNGDWHVRFSSGEGDRVYIITNLNLSASLEGSSFEIGKPVHLDAGIEKDGAQFYPKELAGRLKISARLTAPGGRTSATALFDNGEGGDKTSGDGIFHLAFTPQAEGEHILIIEADGGTFRRTKKFVFRAFQPQARQPRETAVGEAEAKDKKNEPEFSVAALILKFLAVNAALAAVWAAVWFARKKFLKKRPVDKDDKN